MSLSPEAIKALTITLQTEFDKSFNGDTILAIERWLPLVDMINNFVKFEVDITTDGEVVGRQIGSIQIQEGSTSRYESETHTVYLGADNFNINADFQHKNQQYKAVAHLAHELTHAFQGHNEDTTGAKYDDAVQYAAEMGNKGEAEAYYNEVVALYEIYCRTDDVEKNNSTIKMIRSESFPVAFWYDTSKAQTNPSPVNYERIYDVVKPELNAIGGVDAEKNKKIGKLSDVIDEMLGGELGSYLRLTYNENYRLRWLLGNTDIAIDLVEALESNFYSRDPSHIKNSRNSAYNDIKSSPEYCFYLKTLLNQANGYLGTHDTDIDNLEAIAGGSVLGSATEIIGTAGGTMKLDKVYAEVLWGGEGVDNIRGGKTNDLLLGGDGDDHLYGLGGDDRLVGNRDSDHLYGGDGNDHLYGGDGDDWLYGDGDDAVSSIDESEQELGGNDWLYGGKGDDWLYGGTGDDYLYGDDEDGFLLSGNDHLFGGSGDDKLWGGKGDDHLYGDGYDEASGKDENKQGAGGSDRLYGGAGDDHLWGGKGMDFLYGEEDNDHLHGGTGVNFLYGGSGNDTYYIGKGKDFIFDQGQGDTLVWTDHKGKDQQLGNIYSFYGQKDTYTDNHGLTYKQFGSLMYIYDDQSQLITVLNNFGLLGKQRSSLSNYGLNVIEKEMPEDNSLDAFDASASGAFHTVNAIPSREGQTLSLSTGTRHDLVNGGAGNEIMNLGVGNDYANGGLGHDVINGGVGNDVILGSSSSASEADADKDHDRLIGGDGRDLIFGGIGNDLIITGTVSDEPGSRDDLGDWAVGGSGNDTIYGSQGSDFLNGGAGADTIQGGGGNDVILGDGDFMFSTRLVTNGVPSSSMYTWNANLGKWNAPMNSTGLNVSYVDSTIFNWSMAVSAGERPDFTIEYDDAGLTARGQRRAEGGGGDIIYAGAGNDWVAGQTGDDFREQYA